MTQSTQITELEFLREMSQRLRDGFPQIWNELDQNVVLMNDDLIAKAELLQNQPETQPRGNHDPM